jgi:hypothetical protein
MSQFSRNNLYRAIADSPVSERSEGGGGACCVVLFTCGPDCVQHGAWDASAGMHLRLLFLENNREANVVLVFKEK